MRRPALVVAAVVCVMLGLLWWDVMSSARVVGSELPVPALTGPVVDTAQVVDAPSAAKLEALARSTWDGGRGPQLQILVVPSLRGEPIEEFSIRVAEAWKLGAKGRDDGLLLAAAIEDRKVRIEVGGGLEGFLTDAECAQVIREVIAPAFRERRYGDGLVAAATRLLSDVTAPDARERAAARRAAQAAALEEGERDFRRIFVPAAVLFGSVLLLVLGLFLYRLVLWLVPAWDRRAVRTGPDSWAPRSFWGTDGSSSSSSGSGGSWSGGGGGFSGGGASGSW